VEKADDQAADAPAEAVAAERIAKSRTVLTPSETIFFVLPLSVTSVILMADTPKGLPTNFQKAGRQFTI
jgi:hypothetical protein